MSVKKLANGSWQYDVRHPVTKRRYRIGGFPTKKEADEARSVMLSQWRNAKHGTAPSGTTTKKVRLNLRDEVTREAELLHAEAGDNFFRRTHHMTAWTAMRFIEYLPVGLLVTDLHADHLRRIIQMEFRRGRKSSAVSTYMTQFRKVLTRIRERNAPRLNHWEIPVVPVSIQAEDKLRRPWTPDETFSVLDTLAHPERYSHRNRKTNISWKDAHDALAIGALTGMRKTEIMLLEWGKIHFEWGIISARTLKRKGGKIIYREIPMTDELVDLLRARRDWHLERYGKDEPMLFPQWRKDTNSNWLYRSLKQACKLAGVQYGQGDFGVVPHGLRHAAVSQVVANGTDLRTAADIFGHTVETMMKTYAHSTVENKRRALGNLSLANRGGDGESELRKAA